MGKLNIYLPKYKKLSKTNHNLCNGALINYEVDQDGEKFRFNNINVIDVPFTIAKKNILFFHHIIELFNYFVPFGLASYELFELLIFAFFSFDKLDDYKLQKIFLTKFFLQTGSYPENEVIKNYFHAIMTIPIDSLTNITIDLDDEKELSIWIVKCLNMHPYVRSFKTMNFLNEIIVS